MESAVTLKTAVPECGEPNQLISERTLAKYGNPSTAYEMCSGSTRKITFTAI